MNKVVKGFLAILILVIISILIFYQDIPFLKRLISSNNVSLNEAEIQSSFTGTKQLEVDAIVVKPSPIQNKLEVTGELIPNEYVELKSEMSGILDEIKFGEGQFIVKEQLLAKINVDELLAQKEKLEYTKKLRESMEFRQRQLLEREAISQEEYDEALTELQTSSADINLLTTQIKKSEIRAPFSGIMGLRQVSRGAYVTSSTVIAPLYSINPAKLEFSIPGKYSNEVKVGNIVSFTVESSENIYSGKVHAIEPRIDPNTRTIRLRALSPNPGNLLFPGQFARVELILKTKNDALLVPTESIIPELGGNKLFIARNGIAVPVQVTAGMRTDTDLEITNGISAGDTVITTGILQLRPGLNVQINIKN